MSSDYQSRLQADTPTAQGSLRGFAIGGSAGITSNLAAEQRAVAASDTSDTMARRHHVQIEAAGSALQTRYAQTVTYCEQSASCTLIQSTLNSGPYASAHVEVRLAPSAVDALIEVATQGVTLLSRGQSAQDLAVAIGESEELLAMLRQYLKDLQALRETAKRDVDALIRLASETASAQSRLEAAEQRRARLQRRIDTDVVWIQFSHPAHADVWRPINEAFKQFVGRLAQGVGDMISTVAVVLPWLLLLVVLFYGVRWLRR